MKNVLGKAAIAIALAGLTTVVSAHPRGFCKAGTVRVIDTGLVFTGEQKVPEGLTWHKGDRPGDMSVTCADVGKFCEENVEWFARPARAKQGWPGDEVLDTDPRVIKGRYDPKGHAMIFENIKVTDAMRGKDGKFRLHYAARIKNGPQKGLVVAAYQPQVGCSTDKDEAGNPHTVVQ